MYAFAGHFHSFLRDLDFQITFFNPYHIRRGGLPEATLTACSLNFPFCCLKSF